jgi:putative membrane protein
MPKQLRWIPLVAACGFVALSGHAHAALSRMDRTFMIKAAQINIGEVNGGHLAQTRAVNDRVRDYAQKMIEDHSSANNDLKRLARRKRVTLPRMTDRNHRAMANRLARFSGAPFDRAYMRAMSQGHQKAIALFSNQARYGRDADVRAWASKMLPTLHRHHAMARDLATSRAVRTGAKSP